MIQGRKAAHASPLVGFAFAAAGAGIVAAESSRPRSLGDSHSSFGCHTRTKPIRQAIEMREAPMSTIQGLMKFEMRNCGIANETPHTRMAGQTSIMPRQPANAHTTQNGTISEKKGNCRPT